MISAVFTGLVAAQVPVQAFTRQSGGARLRLPLPGPDWDVRAGESIAVSGACLTVASLDGASMEFELSSETLARTWFAELAPPRRVNLERALRLADRLGGHLVTGHVDAVGAIAAVAGDRASGWTFTFEVPEGFERYLVDKGCVAVEGISLTVVRPQGRRFAAAVIPTTFDQTTLGSARPGQRVHLEADLLAKYAERLLAGRA